MRMGSTSLPPDVARCAEHEFVPTEQALLRGPETPSSPRAARNAAHTDVLQRHTGMAGTRTRSLGPCTSPLTPWATLTALLSEKYRDMAAFSSVPRVSPALWPRGSPSHVKVVAWRLPRAGSSPPIITAPAPSTTLLPLACMIWSHVLSGGPVNTWRSAKSSSRRNGFEIALRFSSSDSMLTSSGILMSMLVTRHAALSSSVLIDVHAEQQLALLLQLGSDHDGEDELSNRANAWMLGSTAGAAAQYRPLQALRHLAGELALEWCHYAGFTPGFAAMCNMVAISHVQDLR
ncbi:hypothetical protein DFH07DRAFT_782570 [Mycena maculata]|uniref:Uncharacterized protein n=1 Tax=Mycena maculata TaxID=230809 RepID=A0AAD7HT71_9AGAR|nr:hypothetical protein DFH07DRAFT_1000297 [Mycena maculata]KAJ7727154.1 hypothetical protein DFH07DRAFT_782570 [Mycena maculata]